MPLSSPQFAGPRHAFSLVELLVVVSIIAVMAGLVVSSLFRNRDSNRLLAAEHMLVDSIRQARHTARSTSSPVELRIAPIVVGEEVTGARVSGISRVAIWGETFDGDGQLLPPSETDQGPWVVGRSGNGWIASQTHPIPAYTFERGQALVRGTKSEGFYIACQVRPPAAGSSLQFIPLLLIGDSDELLASQCGLVLTATPIIVNNNVTINTWHIEGWVHGKDNTELTYVSSLNPQHRPLARQPIENNLLTSAVSAEGQALLAPDRWVEIGLLYDGQRLMLFVDGKRIAVHHGDVPAFLIPGNNVFIGQNTPPPADSNAPPMSYYANCPMDDVRLYRLGTSDVGELPGNIVLVPGVNSQPDEFLGYRILCHSDGRVEVFRDDDDNKRALNDRATETYTSPNDDATITLGQRLVPGSLQYATIKIALDGRVISSLVRPGQQP